MLEEESQNKLRDFVRDNASVTFSLFQSGNSSRTKRAIQHMASLRHADADLRAKYEVLLQHALTAESQCPRAGIELFRLFCGSTSSCSDDKVATKQDVLLHLRQIGLSDKVCLILEVVLDHASKDSKVSVKKSTGKTYVEVYDGHTFSFRPLLSTPPVELDKAKVACIDGYVEDVSELHHLLTSLSETKSPCLMFVRGMSQDVLHTLKVNNDRKTLLVFPYIVPFDVSDVNSLVDLAVVSGTDVLSSTKGDLISSMGINSLGEVESCSLSGDVLKMKSTNHRRVYEHTQYLKQLILDRPEIEEVLSRRLKSMASQSIDVSIPDDIHFYSVKQQLDEGIRVISAVFSDRYKPREVASEVYSAYCRSQERTAQVRLL